MNREVSFCTDLFESREVQPHFINERCFGEDLAKWLIGKLKGSGFSFGEPYQEDWGWEIEAKVEGSRLYIQIGIMDESIGADEAEWLISVEMPRRWFSFGKEDSKSLSELCGAIDKVLRNEKAITQVQWQD